MAISGHWNITIKTPMGDQESMLDLKAEGNVLTGALIEKNGDHIEITDGKADGNNLTWNAKVNKPMPMDLIFTATVDGDKISGGAKSPFGTAPFTGVRSAS
jgi:hypothetical protein